jgi:serine phosphatase RsbU (regulator of sigma subunit)
MGHGVSSALIAALAVGSYRHDRREGRALEHTHASLDAAIAEHLPEFTFATGQLAQIDLDTGVMTWTNAGHPLPMLIRGGQVIRELECPPTFPWGLGGYDRSGESVTLATEALEPGDGVLFYTDGVVEARVNGEPFGVQRLVDLVGQHASTQLEPEELIRRLVRALLARQDDRLDDDATLVLVQWNGSELLTTPTAPS